MRTILLTTGLACVIAALAGGGLKAFGMEISALNSVRRQVALGAFGGVLALLAFTRYGEPDGSSSSSDTTRGTPPHETPNRHSSALPGTGDTITFFSIVPRPGTILGRGKRLTFQVGVRYRLTSIDTAQIELEFPEFRNEKGGCHGHIDFIEDEGNNVTVLRGERDTVFPAIWHGDNPTLLPNEKVHFLAGLGAGYVTVRPGFRFSALSVKTFEPFSEYCYLFQ